jgi:hypothetical protein
MAHAVRNLWYKSSWTVEGSTYLFVQCFLNQVAYAGGVVVCQGTGCNVIFKEVTFEGCSLVLLDGARVSLEHATFEQGCSAAEAVPTGISIIVHGAHTSLEVDCGSINGGVQGVAVQVLHHLLFAQPGTSGRIAH